MSFTSVYHFQNLNGCESVISKDNSKMNFMGFRRILLEAGQTLEYTVEGEEQGLVLQNGDFTATVCYKGKVALDQVSGTRHSVYEELPTALYLPPKAEVKMCSKEGCEIRIFTAWMEEGEEGNGVDKKDFISRLNPDSLSILHGYAEPCIQESPVGTTYQFLRNGYFCKDPDSTSALPVFNRTVGLKDTWAKMAK